MTQRGPLLTGSHPDLLYVFVDKRWIVRHVFCRSLSQYAERSILLGPWSLIYHSGMVMYHGKIHM